MKEIKQAVTIDRPVHEAFNFTLNPENTPKWVDGVATEHINETPTKLGTIYINQDHDGNWREFKITAFKFNDMFEMTEKGSKVHVRYTFTSLSDAQCYLEYEVRDDNNDLDGVFNPQTIQQILQKLKTLVEE